MDENTIQKAQKASLSLGSFGLICLLFGLGNFYSFLKSKSLSQSLKIAKLLTLDDDALHQYILNN